MNFSFHPDAEREFLETIDFYEGCEAGLGQAFAREVFDTIDRILHFPDSWPNYSHRSRRCLCRRFPFAVIYRISGNEAVIYAVAHQKRKPNYWKNR